MYLSDGKYLVVTSSQSQPAFYWKKSLESLMGRICIIDKNGFFLCQQKDTNVIQSIFYDISPPNNYIFGKGKASKLIQVNPKMEVPFPSNLGVLNPCWVLVPKYGRKVNSSLTTTWFSGLTSFVKKNWLLFRSNAILNYFSSIRVFSFYFTINNLHENPKMYFFWDESAWEKASTDIVKTWMRFAICGRLFASLFGVCRDWPGMRAVFLCGTKAVPGGGKVEKCCWA